MSTDSMTIIFGPTIPFKRLRCRRDVEISRTLPLVVVDAVIRQRAPVSQSTLSNALGAWLCNIYSAFVAWSPSCSGFVWWRHSTLPGGASGALTPVSVTRAAAADSCMYYQLRSVLSIDGKKTTRTAFGTINVIVSCTNIILEIFALIIYACKLQYRTFSVNLFLLPCVLCTAEMHGWIWK